MSSYESIYKKMAASLEQNGDGNLHESDQKFDPARHIAPIVAHELNNILTIVQGYADRLLLRHGEDLALAQHLRLISEAAKRATTVVREATPSNRNNMFRQPQNPQPAHIAT
jgi:signal transduction histidine kinase